MPTLTLPQGAIHYRDHRPSAGERADPTSAGERADPTSAGERADPASAGSPTVVFVHGALVNGSLWREVAPGVADAGLRAIVPDLPLGSQPEAMAPDADLSPRGVARIVIEMLERLDLADVCLVANDTGGAVTQLLLDTDASRVGRVVFTNCDTFDRFPPPPFSWLFKAGRLPGAIPALVQATRLTAIRHALGYSPLVAKPLDPAQTRDWLHPATTSAAVRRDLRKLLRAIDPAELVDAATRLHEFDGPVLLTWAREDRFFRIEDGRRLAACFRDARVVEIAESRTFVPHDQPERLIDEIVTFVHATTADASAAAR